MKPLEQYWEESRSLQRDGFLERVNNPVLLHRQGSADIGRAFKTTVVNMLASGSAHMGEVRYVVFPLLKRPGGMYADRISVGRTRVADVSLEYPQISKFHAYFTQEKSQWKITDAGATNGTFLEGVRLGANETKPLNNGARLLFGPLSFTFYLPGGFYDYLRGLAEPPQQTHTA